MNWLNRFSDKSPLFIPLALLAITASFCTLPLFVNQSLPLAQDIVFHIFQADQFSKALNDGILYPRWISDANNGYGSPSFIFYAPLSYYIVSAIKYFIPSLTTAMTVAIWLSFFLSGVAMLFSAEKIFGKSGSLISAIVYQILPFHIFDLYIRGTFAELFSFVWFPLIILFMYRMFYSGNNKKAFAGLSISYAGLILTHLVSGFIFTFVIGTYLIYNYKLTKDKNSLFRSSLSILSGLSLSSFYLLPVIFEQKFVQIEYIVNWPVGDYKKNFLFTWDKIQTKLQYFYLPLHFSVLLELLLFIFIVLLLYKNREKLLDKSSRNFFVFIFLTAFFLTTPLSRPIWDIMPGFKNLQFPWRWVPVMEFSLCFLISGVFSRDNYKKDLIMRLIVYLIITVSFLSFVTILKSKPLPKEFMNKITDPLQFQLIMDPTIEYTPVWATSLEEILAEKERDRVSVISGAAMSQIMEWRPEKRAISVKASEPSLLRIATFYFPGWEAEVDGRNTQIKTEKDSGAMLVDVSEGDHTLELRFEDTPIRYYSKVISFITLLALLIFAFSERLFKKKRGMP